MIIDLMKQAMNARIPLNCTAVYNSSSLAIEVTHLRMFADLGALRKVEVIVVNADGLKLTAEAKKVERTNGDAYTCTFASTNFEHYGFVVRGVKIVLTISPSDDEEELKYIAGVGDFEVMQASADATAGNPGASGYEARGEDVYLRTEVVDGVQHYTKQVMVYDAAIGWGATWEGDYILTDGEFVKQGELKGAIE